MRNVRLTERLHPPGPGRRRGIRALGVHEALGGGDRKSVLVAETDVRMLRVGVAPLLDIMEDHFDLAVDFLALRASELLRFD